MQVCKSIMIGIGRETITTIRWCIAGVLLAFVWVNSSAAQNIQILGGSSVAKECFRASAAAAISGSASGRDLDYCEKRYTMEA